MNANRQAGGASYVSGDSHRGGRRAMPGGRRDNPDVRLSKKLSFILRHGAERQGFKLLPGGFLYVQDILRHEDFTSFSEEDVKRVVDNSDKKRFHIEKDGDGKIKIRANQGHSLDVKQLELLEINKDNVSEFPCVVHGTYKKALVSIKQNGLSKMGRNHIHCAPGVPGDDSVTSGMRKNCQILVFINLPKALEDGIKFYKSENDVILTEGNTEGYLLPIYFEKILDRSTNKNLL